MITRFLRRVALAAAAVLAASGSVFANDHIAWIDDLGLSAGVPLVTLPPAAGAVIGLDEQRKQDSYVQTITLQGDPGTTGENQIVVTVTRNGLAPRIEQNGIADEMAERLPDLAMSVGPAGTRNAFGIFGSSTGSRGPLNCFYGWQGVSLADRWITGEPTSLFNERHALSIRVRLCRTLLTTDEMTALFAAAQGRGSMGQTQVEDASGFDPLLAAAGLAGANLSPSAQQSGTFGYPPVLIRGPGTQVRSAERDRPRPIRRRHVRAQPVRALAAEPMQAPPAPMAGMPTVPLPQ